MYKIIMPYIRYTELAILAGLGDDEIVDLFSLQFSIGKSDICQVRKQLYSTIENKNMAEENIKRFENNELPLIIKKVADSYKYTADFQTLINDFSSAKPLQEREKSTLKDLTEIFYRKDLRRFVECFAMLGGDIDSLNSLLAELDFEQISQNVYDRYLWWFWDSNKYSQKEFATFLYARRSEEQYRLYINPLIHNIEDILRSFGKVSDFEIMRKNNLIFHKTQEKINSALDRGFSPTAGDIALLFSIEKSLSRYEKLRPTEELETDIDKKYNWFMQEDEIILKPLPKIFVVPHENLIRQMFYTGMLNEGIEMVLNLLGFNKIPRCLLDIIYHKCISNDEGAAMIEENRRRLPLRKELYESTTIRDKFIDGGTYDPLLKWLQGDLNLNTFPLKEILLERNKRELIENAVMAGMPFERLEAAWFSKFEETLTIDLYRSFVFYCWNLPDGSKDGLYQYLVQESESDNYKLHRQLLDKEPLDILAHFHLLNKVEKEKYEQLAWSKNNHLREEIFRKNNFLLTPWLQSSLVLSLENMMKNDKRMNKEYGRSQLQRIFDRITGKVRYTRTRSDIDAQHRKCEERNARLKKEKIKEDKK